MIPTPHYATAVATAREDASARSIADTMAFHAIGSVVIVDDARRPIGIVTDRDLCVRVVAAGLDPETTRAGAIATRPVHVADVGEPLDAVIERMRKAGVRRMPVVTDGVLSGLVTLDDLVVSIGRELDWLGSAAKLEVRDSLRAGRRSRLRADVEETLATLEASAYSAGRDAVDFVTREFDALRERIRGAR
jgi:CBS domain-containing protein